MSLCINPNCQKPSNLDNSLYCQCCGSELLLKGRYRVTRLLSSKGGFGNTYEAIDNNGAKVLKVLINNHPHAVKLFQQETEVLNRLNHSGIPKGEGFFTYFARASKTPLSCLIMEKIEGVDLEEYLQERNFKPIEQKLALQWLFQLTNILNEVHRQNFFHRDIKPSNIILKPNGQLVLIDFGAARQVTATILAGQQNTQIYTSIRFS
jgi:serine/threonine protein kinase